MSNPIDVQLDIFHENDNSHAKVTINTFDTDQLGKEATFTLFFGVDVKDSRPVNSSKVLFEKNITLSAEPIVFDIPLNKKNIFTYKGHKIDICLTSHITLARPIIFDKKIKEKHFIPNKHKPQQAQARAASVIEPDDRFDLMKNINAIPYINRMFVFLLMIVGGIIIAVNTFIGAHDQMVPETSTWLYSHRDSDGDSTSPLMTSLTASGALGAGVWYLIKQNLKKYMVFIFKMRLPKIAPNTQYQLKDFITGRPRVDLKNFKIRVVAANMEKGQYRRGSGTSERTVSFNEPGRAIMLYEVPIGILHRNQNLVDILPDETFDFDKMYKNLFPPEEISKNHGLELRWEIQLLHKDLIDQELIGKNQYFNENDFWELIDTAKEYADV